MTRNYLGSLSNNTNTAGQPHRQHFLKAKVVLNSAHASLLGNKMTIRQNKEVFTLHPHNKCLYLTNRQ